MHDCVSSNPQTSVIVGLVPGPVLTTTWNFSGDKCALPGNSSRKHADVTSSSNPIMLHCVSMLATQGGETDDFKIIAIMMFFHVDFYDYSVKEIHISMNFLKIGHVQYKI